MLSFILLASGFGRRFGSNKLIYEINGKPMYLHTLEKLHRLSQKEIAGHKVQVVVVSQYEQILNMARKLGCIAVENTMAQEGIAASVRLGIGDGSLPREASPATGSVPLPREASPATGSVPMAARRDGSFVPGSDPLSQADFYFFFTADQPYLKEETIENFASTFLKDYEEHGHTMASVHTRMEPGNPTAFHEKWKDDLLSLTGDKGGRKIMKMHPQEVFWFEIGADEKFDIDEHI